MSHTLQEVLQCQSLIWFMIHSTLHRKWLWFVLSCSQFLELSNSWESSKVSLQSLQCFNRLFLTFNSSYSSTWFWFSCSQFFGVQLGLVTKTKTSTRYSVKSLQELTHNSQESNTKKLVCSLEMFLTYWEQPLEIITVFQLQCISK